MYNNFGKEDKRAYGVSTVFVQDNGIGSTVELTADLQVVAVCLSVYQNSYHIFSFRLVYIITRLQYNQMNDNHCLKDFCILLTKKNSYKSMISIINCDEKSLKCLFYFNSCIIEFVCHTLYEGLVYVSHSLYIINNT